MLWRLWSKWVLATVIGLDIGCMIAIWMAYVLTDAFNTRNLFIVGAGCGLASVLGSALLSLPQWWVLRGCMANADRWIGVTTGSIALGVVCGAVLGAGMDSPYVGWWLGGLLSVVSLGLAQGRVLGQVSGGSWFFSLLAGLIGAAIGTMTVSWFAGLIAGSLLVVLVFGLTQAIALQQPSWFLTTLLALGAGSAIGSGAGVVTVLVVSRRIGGGWENLGVLVLAGAIAGVIVGAAVFGGITGGVLVRLFKTGEIAAHRQIDVDRDLAG